MNVFSYENFSEGEKMRIDLSLLLAWREIARAKNSINCNLLMLYYWCQIFVAVVLASLHLPCIATRKFHTIFAHSVVIVAMPNY